MPSVSLNKWYTTRSSELDEIESAHQRIGGPGRGRRFATQQINHAYTMLLSSQFQGFCRDLHSESVEHIVRAVNPVVLRGVLRSEFTLHRKLDRGNPNPGNIGSDFNRLGLVFWDRVRAQSCLNNGRIAQIEDLNTWRYAIAHQDFDPTALGGTMTLQLSQVRRWRQACTKLAAAFDSIISNHILQVTGTLPW